MAQEQPLQPVVERVARVGRHAEARAVRGVEAPAHAAGQQPAVQPVQRRRVEAEAAGHDRLLQQREQRAGRQPRRGQVEQPEQRARRRVAAAAGAAAQRVRDPAPGRHGAEDRVDQRRGGVEIRRDDQHVGRAQRRVGGEQREQPVVQRLQLAGARVRDVQLDAAVAGEVGAGAGLELDRVEDRVLQPRQQRVGGVLDEGLLVDAGVAGGVEQPVDLGLGLLAPAGEQPVADLVRGVAAGGLQPGQSPRVDQLEPVFAAGVQRVDLDLDRAAERGQQPRVQRRHRRQREDVDPLGQTGGACAFGAARAFEQRDEAVDRVPGGDAGLGDDAPPQRRLPGGVGARGLGRERDGAAVEPGRQPVGAVGDVLLEHAGDAAGEFPAHHVVGLRQVAGQPRVLRQPAGVAEGAPDAPGEHVGGERRDVLADAGHEAGDLPPQPLREVVEADVGADAGGIGQRQRQPPPQRGARDDQLVGDEHVLARRGQPGDELRGQRVEAVGEADRQHRRDGAGV